MFIYSPFKGPRYNEKLLSPYLNALPGDKYTIEKKNPYADSPGEPAYCTAGFPHLADTLVHHRQSPEHALQTRQLRKRRISMSTVETVKGQNSLAILPVHVCSHRIRIFKSPLFHRQVFVNSSELHRVSFKSYKNNGFCYSCNKYCRSVKKHSRTRTRSTTGTCLYIFCQ